MLRKDNHYTNMQKKFYEINSSEMNQGNHNGHNNNPDYWNILLAEVKDHPEWVCFDFGCGCGRNILNMMKLGVKKVDGCDISENNIKNTRNNINFLLEKYVDRDAYVSELYTTNGVELNEVSDDKYDFVMSTIVLQHICVYDIRYNLLKEQYRVLKLNGIISFQMGVDQTKHREGETSYYENFYDAEGTNSKNDVYIENPEDVVKDLESIGFRNISYVIRPPFFDHHQNWIYFRAYK